MLKSNPLKISRRWLNSAMCHYHWVKGQEFKMRSWYRRQRPIMLISLFVKTCFKLLVDRYSLFNSQCQYSERRSADGQYTVECTSFYKIQRQDGTCRLLSGCLSHCVRWSFNHHIHADVASLHLPSKYYLVAVTVDTNDNIRPEFVTTCSFATFTAEIFAPSRTYLHVLVAAQCNFSPGRPGLRAAWRNPWDGRSLFWSNLPLEQSVDQSGPAGLTKRQSGLSKKLSSYHELKTNSLHMARFYFV